MRALPVVRVRTVPMLVTVMVVSVRGFARGSSIALVRVIVLAPVRVIVSVIVVGIGH